MATFLRVPSFLQSRRSFHRLRSFHLSPAEVHALAASSQAHSKGGTKSPASNFLERITDKLAVGSDRKRPILPGNMVIPMRGSTIMLLGVLSSIFFIMVISCAFLGADAGEPFFKETLTSLAQTSPGLVLIGESVDVDVDEPSITIRWSIVGCGEDYILPGSGGAHNVKACGLPGTPLQIYVDSDATPMATYDPEDIPFDRESGQRRSIQNLVQFDSDHVLDVHEARLYPFDTYFLTSTIRATTFENASVPIQKLMTIDITSSFDISTKDLDSFSAVNGKPEPSRDIDMYVSRPHEARTFTLMMFAVSWVLAHVTVGHVLLARRLHGMRALLPHLFSSGAILVGIQQLRQSMPDAPGFDGVLIDSIGYFPQMIISGISTIMILLILVVRELDAIRDQPWVRHARSSSLIPPGMSSSFPIPPPYYPSGPHGRVLGYPEHRATGSKGSISSIAGIRPRSILGVASSDMDKRATSKPAPPIPNPNSGSREIAQWEMHRTFKSLKGQYVFPPVKPTHRVQTSKDASKPSHRRVQTLSKIREHDVGEVSRWSVDSFDKI